MGWYVLCYVSRKVSRENGDEVENCMNMSDKGKTRSSVSGESDLPEKARFRLKEFYDKFNPILFEKFGVKYDW